MATRLDVTLQKYPDQAGGVRLLAERDPSGNLKYLDWGAKMLAAKQALASEVADIIEMFHRFAGQWLPRRVGSRRPANADDRIRHDIYSYRPQDMAALRDNLLKLQRAQDKKRKQREKLYKIEGECEADVVYDAPDLVVRHIKNKNASCHYGLSTKWCIAMRQENYFEDYESQNATFFFFERKKPLGDEYDKMAVMIPRNADNDRNPNGNVIAAFTSTDRCVDVLAMAKVYGGRFFDILREVYECSERYPGSTTQQVFAGTASAEQLAEVFAMVVSGKLAEHEAESLIESICCNDAAPLSLLTEIVYRVPALVRAGMKRSLKQHAFRRRRRRLKPLKLSAARVKRAVKELQNSIAAAMFIHPQVPDEMRQKLAKDLKRRRINVNEIHRVTGEGRIRISYRGGHKLVRYGHRRMRRRAMDLPMLRGRLRWHERTIISVKKKIEKAEAKKAAKDAKAAAKTAARASS